MDDNIIMLMLGGSLLLGGLGLAAFMWGLRTGQFDDQKRFKYGAMFDTEEDLNDAVRSERKRDESVKEDRNGEK